MAESELADHQISRTAAGTSSIDGTFSNVRCWPAKLASLPSSSTADERTASGVRSPRERGQHALDGLLVLARDRFDDRAREREPRRHRQAVADGVAESDRLRAVDGDVGRLGERDDPGGEIVSHGRIPGTVRGSPGHPARGAHSTVTSPAAPSTRTRVPSAMRSVASRVPTTPGMPYSRATIAACESRPPLSVTMAPSSGSRMLNASVVAGREEHVALLDAAELRRPGDEARRAFVDAGAGGEAAEHVVLVLGVGAAEERVEGDAGGAHDAADGRGQARRVGRRLRRITEERRRVVLVVRGRGTARGAASSSADGPPVPLTSAHISSMFASTMCTGSAMRAALGDPTSGRERGAAHEARRPDVAVDAALVAQPVDEARLAEELVELVAVLLRHLRADLGGELGHVGAFEVASLEGDPDRPEQRVGQLRARRARRCRSRRAGGCRPDRGSR